MRPMLTSQEAERIWPIYREYHAERDKIGNRADQLSRAYAEAYNAGRVTDEQGVKWVNQALEIRADQGALTRNFMARFQKVLPGRKFARYYQIETKLDNLVEAKLSAEIALIE
jgi:hypothetical protein